MANPIDDILGASGNTSQVSRDIEALNILKAERTGGRLTSQADADALEREIQLRSKTAGVQYDYGGTVKPVINTPGNPQAPANTESNPIDAILAPQVVQPTPPQSTQSPTDQPNQIIPAAMAGARGLTYGVTAGVARPAAAAAMYSYNHTLGDGKMSWDDALRTVDEQHQEDIEQHPIANYTGQGVGGLGLAAATGGTSGYQSAGQVATNVGIGALSGASSANNATDATIGAATGGVIGGTLGALGNGVNKLMSNYTYKTIAKETDKPVSEVIKYFHPDPARNHSIYGPDASLGDLLGYEAGDLWKTVKTIGADVLPSTAIGAVGGATAAALNGQNPVAGAVAGGTTGAVLGKTQLVSQVASRAAKAVPYVATYAPSTVTVPTNIATQIVTRNLPPGTPQNQPTSPTEAVNPIDSILGDNRTGMQKLLDNFRSKTQEGLFNLL